METAPEPSVVVEGVATVVAGGGESIIIISSSSSTVLVVEAEGRGAAVAKDDTTLVDEALIPLEAATVWVLLPARVRTGGGGLRMVPGGWETRELGMERRVTPGVPPPAVDDGTRMIWGPSRLGRDPGAAEPGAWRMMMGLPLRIADTTGWARLRAMLGLTLETKTLAGAPDEACSASPYPLVTGSVLITTPGGRGYFFSRRARFRSRSSSVITRFPGLPVLPSGAAEEGGDTRSRIIMGPGWRGRATANLQQQIRRCMTEQHRRERGRGNCILFSRLRLLAFQVQ